MNNGDASPLIELVGHGLIWSPGAGVGFYDCDAYLRRTGAETVYGEEYFKKYQALDAGPISDALNLFRINQVIEILQGGDAYDVLDVGIGSGRFVSLLTDKVQTLELSEVEVSGTDINPFAIQWLEKRNQIGSLYGHYDVLTFWDSLEHFRDPRVPLRAAAKWAIVSLPIFRDAEHALSSKHFRPDEHFWYWTREGFRMFAHTNGFDVVDVRITESLIGREDIETFILKRRPTE